MAKWRFASNQHGDPASGSRGWSRLRRLVFLATASAGLAVAPAVGQVVTATEEELKAAFLYNFVKFVDWPPGALASTDALVLCVESGSFADVLEQTVHGKEVGTRRLELLHWSRDGVPDRCNILFVDELDGEALAHLLADLRGRSVLTVGDFSHFAVDGGIINFIRVADRLRFEVNPAAADRAGLRISSKLMALAEVVEDGGAGLE